MIPYVLKMMIGKWIVLIFLSTLAQRLNRRK